MIDCIAIGDSIAVGIAQVSLCENHASKGKSSHYIAAHYSANGDLCIISAGSNDPNNKNLFDNLIRIRYNNKCKRYVWVLPQNKRAASIVRKVAFMNGDAIVTFEAGNDGVHPKSYTTLAKSIGIK